MIYNRLRLVKILENGFLTLCLALSVVVSGHLSAQMPKTAKLLDFSYGFQAPLGDMQDRFGGSNLLGGGLETINNESRQFWGIDGGFFFGNNVKEDVLTQLRSFDGIIIGIDGASGDVSLKERGYFIGLHGGKIFSTTDKKSSLTGIR